MTFKEYVERYRQQVYSTICDYIKIKDPEKHYRIVRDYSDRQGSYRRPGLLLLSGEMFGIKPEDMMLLAAAMQLSEDWILIHDDIEDHSELRRGKPTLHLLYGMEIAINAGDSGHMAMWRMLKDYMMNNGMKRGNKVYEKFYDMLEHTVEGQFIEDEFIYNVKDLDKATEELYFRIISNKTCYYTVYGPMQLGAIAARQKKSMLALLERIGKPAGIAFQIVDDILDMTADEKVFGKKQYGDLWEGKLTLIILHAYRHATTEEKAKMNKIYAKRREEKTNEEVMFLVEMINKYKSLDYVWEVASKYQEYARTTIEKNKGKLPNNEYAELMFSAMRELYQRNK